MSELTFTEVGEILQLLQRVEGSDVELEWGELKVHVRRGGHRTAQASPDAAQSAVVADSTAALPPSPHPMAVETVATGGSEDFPKASGDTPTTSDPWSDGEIPAHWVAVEAPMVGTFYRAPKPGEPAFVEVGDTVDTGDTVALVEVMKLFTELKSEVGGKVARIDAEDSSLVEFGQALIWVEPA